MFLPFVGRGGKLTTIQRALAVSSSVKAYNSIPVLASLICLPVCLVVLQTNESAATAPDRLIKALLLCHFVMSTCSKKLTHGRLGGQNVLYMNANRIWATPSKQHGHAVFYLLLTNVQSTLTVPCGPSLPTQPTLASKCRVQLYRPLTKGPQRNASRSWSA